MTHMSRHKQFCMESVHAKSLIKKKEFSLTVTEEFRATELSIARGSYLVYSEQKYKYSSFVFAPIFHKLNTKIKDILWTPYFSRILFINLLICVFVSTSPLPRHDVEKVNLRLLIIKVH